MGAGWNLGNTLDACDDSGAHKGLETETSWGMPKTTKQTIDTVAAAGFKSIRIPVSWHNHLTNGKIDADWIARVKEIVDWALEDNLYVVINIHHDTWNASGNFWGYYPDNAHKKESIEYVKNIWQQVAKYFSSYDQRLIFETLNEPRLRNNTKHEWWCGDYLQKNNCSKCSEAVQIVNELNKTALETIRAAGGKNSSRLVIVPSYVASPDYAFKDSFKVPSDAAKMIALSTHMYTPNAFAMASPGDKAFSETHKSDLTYYFNTLNSKFVENDVPVFIGEYGATNKDNKAERIKWVKFFIENASKNGMSPCLWDNNNYAVSGNDYEEKFGYLNRKMLEWYDNDFIDAIMASFK
ncbi:MAG: glycoside hydrolase family 5 protein [Treponemataceae bacterium]|nr:glycoside hydrolase family 5 protein [Treponemataceae bacterium]